MLHKLLTTFMNYQCTSYSWSTLHIWSILLLHFQKSLHTLPNRPSVKITALSIMTLLNSFSWILGNLIILYHVPPISIPFSFTNRHKTRYSVVLRKFFARHTVNDFQSYLTISSLLKEFDSNFINPVNFPLFKFSFGHSTLWTDIINSAPSTPLPSPDMVSCDFCFYPS